MRLTFVPPICVLNVVAQAERKSNGELESYLLLFCNSEYILNKNAYQAMINISTIRTHFNECFVKAAKYPLSDYL